MAERFFFRSLGGGVVVAAGDGQFDFAAAAGLLQLSEADPDEVVGEEEEEREGEEEEEEEAPGDAVEGGAGAVLGAPPTRIHREVPVVAITGQVPAEGTVQTGCSTWK